MTDRPPSSARRRPHSAWGKVVLTLVIVAIAVGSGALALLVTPMQSVSAAGQTVQVGTASPSWDLSGPGELDLFGQQIPTSIDFVGPVRPRLELTHITLTEQLGQFVKDGLDTAGQRLTDALVSGWKRYFVWQVVITAAIAVVLFGALAGWLRWSLKATALLLVLGLLLTQAFNLGAIMVTAYTAPERMRTVNSLQQFVGGVPPPAVTQDATGSRDSIKRVVVVGDSTAAGEGNRLVAHPSIEDKLCNRSRDAFAPDLAASNGWKVTNVACSGATIRNGLLGPQEVAGRSIKPQLKNPAVAKADLVVVSIGANDVHWNVLLAMCALTLDCSNSAQQAFLQQQLAGFSRDLLQLFSQLQLLPNHPTVVVNQYYNPFPGSVDCLKSHGLTEAKKRSLEHQLTALNTVLAKGATAAGFRTATPNFVDHGVCAPQPYVQGLNAKAPFHPTASGQLAIALAIENALHLRGTPDQAPTSDPGPSSREPTTSERP